VNLLISIEDKTANEEFFKKYFDILAQGVFYSFFYAFPKSRSEFGDQFKRELIEEFSYLFTGVHISNAPKYFERWNLDLGAGNILRKVEKKKNVIFEQSEPEQPLLPLIPVRSQVKSHKQRVAMDIRFSPILERYINKYQYKTKNYVIKFRMKFTHMDKHQEQTEENFRNYLKIADEIKRTALRLKEEND